MRVSQGLVGTPLSTGMTNTKNSTLRTASGLFAGLTIVAVGLVGTPGSVSADTADYVSWRQTDSAPHSAPFSKTLTFTATVTPPG